MKRPIYLDHNATTPLLAEAAEAMARCQAELYGNPASQHAAGRRARQALEEAREGIGRILGAEIDQFDADRVIFTSGGTEANHLALLGLAGREPAHAVISGIEHPSVVGPAEYLERERGWRLSRLPVSSAGQVEPDRLPELLQPDTRFVSVMLANNETGVLQPAAAVAKICAQAGVALHVDAAQAVGKTPVHFRSLGASLMTVAAHKFHGPVGIGALIVRQGAELQPQMFGGFQQGGLRPGTEAVALAVGMHVALRAWQREQQQLAERMAELRDRFERTLLADCPELSINGQGAERLPHVSSVTFPAVEGQVLMMALDLAGICCSTGSACASGSSQASPTLLAMGVEKGLAERSLRFSFGRATTAEEGAEACRLILKTYKDLRDKNSARKSPVSPPTRSANSL